MVTQMDKMIAQAKHRNELEFADILEGKEIQPNVVCKVSRETIYTKVKIPYQVQEIESLLKIRYI